jgi:hypothetical protein
MKKSFIGAAILVYCTLGTGFAAQTWQSLDANQRQALAPLAQQWHTLPEKQQQGLLRIAKRYPTLTPAEKQRLQKKLIAWSKLTPEQRKAAREKYRTFRKNPIQKHERVKQWVKQKEPKKQLVAPASGIPPAITSAVLAPAKN